MSEHIEITIPKDALIVVVDDKGARPAQRMLFVDDFIIGNVCAAARFFGENLLRRRIGHQIAARFRGKKPGDRVTLPRALAFELWRAASELPYTASWAVQLPDEWLWAIPEVEDPSAPPPEPAAQKASEEDVKAIDAIAQQGAPS